MLPKEKAGIINPTLKEWGYWLFSSFYCYIQVYGTRNITIVDSSIVPLTHSQCRDSPIHLLVDIDYLVPYRGSVSYCWKRLISSLPTMSMTDPFNILQWLTLSLAKSQYRTQDYVQQSVMIKIDTCSSRVTWASTAFTCRAQCRHQSHRYTRCKTLPTSPREVLLFSIQYNSS